MAAIHPTSTTESLPAKARDLGVAALADDELVAFLIGSSSDRALVAARHLLRHGMLDLAQAVALPGLTPAQANRVRAGLELGRRLTRANRRTRPSCRTPEEVVPLVAADLALLPHEELWCLPLDPHCRLIGEPRVVSRGDTDGTDAGPRAFTRLALQAGATSAIALHNHPSGDPTPSAADRAVTQRLAMAGRLVDIPLVDHLVIAGNTFTSLRRQLPDLFR